MSAKEKNGVKIENNTPEEDKNKPEKFLNQESGEENANCKKFKLNDFIAKFGLLIICSVLGCLFLGSCFIPYFSIPAFVLILICVLFYNLKDSLSVIFFAIPFCCVWLPATIIMLMSCLIVYLVRIFIHNYKEKKVIFSKLTIIALCTLLVWLVFPFKNYYNGMFAIKIVAMLAIFVLIYLCLNNGEELRIKFNVSMLAYGLILASICFCLIYPLGGYLSEVLPLLKINGKYIRFAALFTNTNVLAMVCEMGIAILTYYFIINKFGYREIFAFAVLMVLGFLTLSKTFLIIFAVMTIFLIIFGIKNFKNNGWKILSILGIGALIVCLISWESICFYIQRFLGDGQLTDSSIKDTGDVLSAVTTARSDLWIAYIKDMLSNPAIIFFGKGFGTPTLPEMLSPHNLYISLLYQLGLIGIGLIAFVVVCLIKDAKKISNFVFNKYSLVSILAFMLLFCVEDLIFYIY